MTNNPGIRKERAQEILAELSTITRTIVKMKTSAQKNGFPILAESLEQCVVELNVTYRHVQAIIGD